ncbi:MAG: serine hydrolase [Burkholderiaceae bacterium]
MLKDIIAGAEASGIRVGLHATRADGACIAHRGDEIFPSASTIKLAIMIELFRRVDAGALSLDQPHVLRPSDQAGGGGVLQHMSRGLSLPLRDLCYLMMSLSDNLATNILIEQLGIAEINATIRSLGLKHSVLARPMQGRPAIEGEQENLATPAEVAHLVRCILDGSAAGADSCRAMTRMMALQQNGRRIGRFVPAGTPWGSKTGSYPTVVHDVGYVQLGEGPMIVAAFTQDVPDIVAGELLISEMVRVLLSSVEGAGWDR